MKQNSEVTEYEELEFRQLFKTFWDRKWLIFSITTLFAVISILYALSIPDEYRANTVLAPAESDRGSLSGTEVSSTDSGFGGLAAFTGINVKQNSESKIALSVMRSWGFIDQFIKKNGIEILLAAGEGWDKKTKEVIYNKEVYDFDNARWLRPATATRTSEPTSWELYKLFNDRLMIVEDRKTGMISVSITYFSPIVSKEWVDLYVSSINAYMQNRRISQATLNINYLNKELRKTQIAEMKAMFHRLLGDQTRSLMIASATPEYVFTTVSKTMLPELKFKPIRSSIVIVSTIFGFFVSIILVLTIDRFKLTPRFFNEDSK